MLAFIWAEDEVGHIGYEGKLPWHLPADLAYFKAQTLGHPMIMGKNTFKSFPGFLPKRLHVGLTHEKQLQQAALSDDRLMVFDDLSQLKAWLAKHDELVFIIGGASLFAQFKDQVDQLFVTKIHSQIKGDTKMPELDYAAFELVKKESGKLDDKNKYPHTFYVYQKRQ